MDDEPIREIPSLKKMQEDAKNFSVFKKAWPLLRPVCKLLGVDVEKIDETLKQADYLALRTAELASLPDDFNNLFTERGWILYDWMNFDLAKKAIEIGKAGDIEKAEKVLVEFYTPEEVDRELKTLMAIEAFQSRMSLAEKACIDFKEERYYSTVLVVLSLLDGMVNEIQQKGFFAKNVDLTAWDSVAAHSKGLQKLTALLSQTRKMTRTEQITIPYRHGIMHGMDLGYDNRLVAVKSWVALFATRDWAVKAERNQLEAPPPKPEKTWKELLQQLQDLERDKKALANWKPRDLDLGTDIPISGEPTDYNDISPEQKFAEFLEYWKTNNYGYMAKCISTQFGHAIKELPMRIREEYYGKQLKSWELSRIKDESPAITVITAQVIYEENGLTNIKLLNARLICEDAHSVGVIRGKPGSRWALVTWYLKEVKIDK